MDPFNAVVHAITRAATRPGDDITSPGDWAHAAGNVFQHPLGALSHGLTSPYGLPMGIVGPSRVPGHVIESVDPGGKFLDVTGGRYNEAKGTLSDTGVVRMNDRMYQGGGYAPQRAINIRRAGTDPGKAGPIAASLYYLKPGTTDPRAYVASMFVKPQFRNTTAMMDMIAQLRRENPGAAIDPGAVINDRLAAVIAKLIARDKGNVFG